MTGVTYNVFNQPTAATYGSADSDSFSYDPNTGRMTQFGSAINGSSRTGALTWNANGSLAQLNINDPLNSANTQICNNTHDDLSRIATVKCANGSTNVWGQTFSLDAFGNLTKQNAPGYPGTNWQPNYANSPQNNRYSSIPTGTPSYDVNGNLTLDGFHTYTWDSDGNMSTIDSYPQITYDALDRRVEEVGSRSSYKEILYGPSGAKLGMMVGQTVTDLFLPLPGGGTAVYTSSGLAFYRHADWLSNSRLASTPSRTLYYDGAYAAFGESYSETGTTDHSFTGQGQNLVELTNDLYDFLFREYHPTQGRWIQPDPAGLGAVNPTNPQSWNRYAYVLGNPLRLTDPFGLENDCGGPCTPFTYVNAQGCVVSVTFYPVNGNGGDDGGTQYDYPVQSIDCNRSSGQGSSGAGGSMGAGGGTKNGPTITAAPPVPWYKNSCITGALGNAALHVSIDAIGLIPEAEGFIKVFENTAGYQLARTVGNTAGYRGVVATQYGMKVVPQGKGAVAMVNGAFGLGDTSVEGRISTALTVAGFIPGLGSAAAAASIGVDLFTLVKAIGQCQ